MAWPKYIRITPYWDGTAEKPTTILKLKHYLKVKKISFKSLDTLSGGTANYLFLLRTRAGVVKVVKHAEPYIASSDGAIPFPDDRMDFENTAMTKIAKLITPKMSPVRVPKIIKYDEEFKVLLMTHAGAENLKEAYGKHDLLHVSKVGRQLGEWLATLHHSTKETDSGEGGNPTGKAMYRWAYSHLAQVAEHYGLDVEFCKYIDGKYGSLLQTDDDCVCHGDFWPGNVLLEEGKLTVVDWEMCRRGCGATDVGQFSAEAYLLDRFCGGRGVQHAFLQGYREKMLAFGVDIAEEREFAKRVAVHMGVHLAFWPASVKWAEQEETKAVIELGHELIRHGDEEDLDWLGKNLLTGLLGKIEGSVSGWLKEAAHGQAKL
ncbi:MAG: hypothetical protein Q9201_000410 [Fulgogasparrea decipioides]